MLQLRLGNWKSQPFRKKNSTREHPASRAFKNLAPIFLFFFNFVYLMWNGALLKNSPVSFPLRNTSRLPRLPCAHFATHFPRMAAIFEPLRASRRDEPRKNRENFKFSIVRRVVSFPIDSKWLARLMFDELFRLARFVVCFQYRSDHFNYRVIFR